MHPRAQRTLGRLYIISFNIYAFYWLYDHWGTNAGFDAWLQWFFACAGMNFFFQDKKKEYKFGPK